MEQHIDTSDRELVITRVIKAPRERVFDAWSDPQHISNWWGPHGFTTTTAAMDVRVGGHWRFVMHGPDGTDYQNLIVYTEVTRPERLRYDHSDGGANELPSFKTVVTFEEQGAHTLLTLRMICATVEQYEGFKAFGATEGGHQTLERLDQFLAG